MQRITITVSEEALQWARRKAAEENTSVARLIGRMLEERMRVTDGYRNAYERWKKIKPVTGFDASNRLKRDELYDRR
jgi:hypothetical protein